MTQSTEYFLERHRGGERAILVHMYFRQQYHETALIEFEELALSDELEVLALITGKRDTPESKYFVGTGKAQEIMEAVQFHGAEAVIFNHELTPAQGRNLEQLFNCRVIDRTELILDIFAKRARTFEGKLQVELAQLQHLNSRLVRGWTHLERQKGGIGLRGPGEKQLESDRRLIGRRIKNIQKRLAKVITHREQARRARKRAAIPTVSIVGYTNAGKSTLFNKLTDAHVYAADQLFATLDPTLRYLQLPKVGKIILADTVGFIRDLPHDLIAAFRATLEETSQADLLLHVVDVSDPAYEDMIHDVEIVLTEIGAERIPQLLVLNKIDLRENFSARLDYNEQHKPIRAWVSADTGEGFDLLVQAVQELLSERLIEIEVILWHKEGKLRSDLYALGVIEHESHDELGRSVLKIKIQHRDYERMIKKRFDKSD